jgi:hypothetical protein
MPTELPADADVRAPPRFVTVGVLLMFRSQLLCGHAPFQFKKELRYEDEASTATEDGRPFDLQRWQHGFVDVDPSLRERFWYL